MYIYARKTSYNNHMVSTDLEVSQKKSDQNKW